MSQKDDLINKPSVETYVEVSLHYHDKCTVIKRTNIDEGSAPKWNEVLSFDINSDKGGFTKDELQSTETVI